MSPSEQQRKLNRRHFLRLAGASAVTALWAGGCRRDAPPPPQPSAPSPSVPAAAARGGTVRWAEFYSTLSAGQQSALGIDAPANQAWLAGIAGQFAAENRGWRVELEPMPLDQVDQRSAYDFNANAGHDLVFATPQLMARHAMLGDLLDLGPFISRLAPTDQQDLGWSAAWQAAHVKGKQLGIPTCLQTYGLAFDRALCQKAGVNPEQPGQTLDQWIENAKRLTATGQGTWGLAAALDGRSLVETLYAPLVWHFGGRLFDEGKQAAVLADDAGRQAAQWIFDLVYRHKVCPRAVSGAAAAPAETPAESLLHGRAALAFGASSTAIRAWQSAGLISGCTPPSAACKADRAGLLPLPTAGQAALTTGRCLAIHSLSKQPDMAFRLLQVILRPENLRSYPDAGLPARASAWQASEFKTPFYQAWSVAAHKGRPMPATPYYWELADMIAVALDDVLGERSGVAEALQRAETQWNSRYAGA